MSLNWKGGALAEGLACYRHAEFFLAHEHWESVWLKCQEPERTFLQALIQVAAAFHHLQRNNPLGATSMLKKALWRLEPYPALFESVEIASLRKEVEMWLEVLEGRSAAVTLPIPQIRLNGLSS